MTDLSTAPASDMDSPGDHDAADAVGGAGTPAAADDSGIPDTAPSALERLEREGWRSLHAHAASGRQAIDHIAVGPGGIFVIDDHTLDADAGTLRSGGVSVPPAAIEAANQIADAVRQILPPLTRQYVVPVLSFQSEAPLSLARGPVQICSTSLLQSVVESRPAAVSGREIDEVVAILSGALDGLAPAPAPQASVPERESRRATPKRRKLGWLGGQHDDDQSDAPADAVPADTMAWPAVTPPPVWESTADTEPVALEATWDDVEADSPDVPVEVEPEPEPAEDAATLLATGAEADGGARDPFVGSFPIGWGVSDEVVDREGGLEPQADTAEATDTAGTDTAEATATADTADPADTADTDGAPDRALSEPVPSAAESDAIGATDDLLEEPYADELHADVDEAPAAVMSPWPTIQLPGPDDHFDLDLSTDLTIEADTSTEPIEPASAPVDSIEPASAPTPIGRTQPGGRRRAPSTPWHERLRPRSRPKSERPEGARRAQPTATSSDDGDAPTPTPVRSRRATPARPRTLSARSTLSRDADEPRRSRRTKPPKSRERESALAPGGAEPPAALSSRGQKMYAAMSARQASAVDEIDDEPTNVAAPIRRLVVAGIAAGLLVASGTHVTSISAWVADHVPLPGVGDTNGNHPKGGDDSPGRSANLDAPGSHGQGGDRNNGGGKQTKP